APLSPLSLHDALPIFHELGKAFRAHPDQPLLHDDLFGRTHRGVAHEVGARAAAQACGAIDHCDICLRQAHRDRVFLAFGGRSHGESPWSAYSALYRELQYDKVAPTVNDLMRRGDEADNDEASERFR